jgi:hypothetical protein
MLNVQVVGSVRTYAHTGRRFSYAAWLDALKRGATLVSTGPVVTLTANGRPIGSNLVLAPGEQVVIEARMEAPYELYPVDVLEIVVGGTVVETVANTAGSSQLRAATTVSARESTWIAARARGSKVMPYQVWRTINATGIPPMAHTSPIYLSVEGRPVWVPEAARQLKARVEAAINWVETQGRYRTEAEREEIVALFQRARQHYTSGPHRGEPGQ